MSDELNDEKNWSVEDVQQLRKTLNLNQDEMAKRMGLSKSAYVAVETKAATLRKIHVLAAQMVAIQCAYESAETAGKLPVHLKVMILDVSSSL